MSQTHLSTQVVTGTKLALALAFLGVSAVFAAAAGATPVNACLNAPAVVEVTSGLQTFCLGQTLVFPSAGLVGNTGSQVKISIRSFNQTQLGVMVPGAIPASSLVPTNNTKTFVYSYNGTYFLPANLSIKYLGLSHNNKAAAIFLVTNPASCLDNDGGKNYYQAGTSFWYNPLSDSYGYGYGYGYGYNAASKFGSSSDVCAGTTLIEKICQAQSPSWVLYDCATEGKTCQNGACVATSTLPIN